MFLSLGRGRLETVCGFLTLELPMMTNSRTWNRPKPIVSTASSTVKVSSASAETQSYTRRGRRLAGAPITHLSCLWCLVKRWRASVMSENCCSTSASGKSNLPDSWVSHLIYSWNKLQLHGFKNRLLLLHLMCLKLREAAAESATPERRSLRLNILPLSLLFLVLSSVALAQLSNDN